MSIVAYVSGHGLGHTTREIEVLRRLPEEIPLVIKSASPEWFWRQEMRRPFTFVADAFDVGCIQRDSLAIEVGETLIRWREVDARNQQRVAAEVEDLRRAGARLVVSDVPSFPLTVAAQARISSALIANFTWADIYAPFVREEPGFAPEVEKLQQEYAQATLLLEAGLALPMPHLPRRESVGLIARIGRDRRPELEALLGKAAEGKRLALIYLGVWGMPFPYERLALFPDWHFVTLDAPPVPAPNLTVADRAWMPHPDFVASVDLVISKLGYGTIGECLTAGTPILYCPRPGFAEHEVTDAYIRERPHGIHLSLEDYTGLRWEEALASVPPRGTIAPEPAPGGADAAERLVQMYRAE